MSEPMGRAGFFQSYVKALSLLPIDDAREVRRREHATIDALMVASFRSWVPLAHDLAFTVAVHDVAGREAVIEMRRHAFKTTADGPLLSPFIQCARAMFDLSPWGVLRMAPLMWSKTTLDAGTVKVTKPEDNFAFALQQDLPTSMVAEEKYHATFEGLAHASLDIARATGNVNVSVVDAKTMRIEVRWTPHGGASGA